MSKALKHARDQAQRLRALAAQGSVMDDKPVIPVRGQQELFPLKVAWPVTGTHQDGSPCYHTSSDCKEHGSCIDCDSCKAECECN